MFKKLINSIKTRIMCKLLAELCDDSVCGSCAAKLGDDEFAVKPRCAQIRILDQVLEKWCDDKE